MRSLYKAAFSTGAKSLDNLIGGVPSIGTLEFVGPPGCGKTQLCHQLAVMVQLPPSRGGLGAPALYVDTEGTFRPERLALIADYRGLDPDKALEGVIYARAYRWEDVVEAVSACGDVGVVLIDSLSRPFRGAYTLKELGFLRGKLCSVAAFLFRWSLERGIPVVFTSHALGAGAFGDPYVSLFSSIRVYLKPVGGGLIEAMVKGLGKVSLAISEAGVLGAEEGSGYSPRSYG